METLIGVLTKGKEIYLIQWVSIQNWNETVEMNIKAELIDYFCKVTTSSIAYTERSKAEKICKMLDDKWEDRVHFIKTIKLY